MSTDDKLTTDSIINAILTEEKSRQDGSATALLARAGNVKSKSKTKQNEKKKKRCDYCKKLGHIKDKCRKLKSDEASKEDHGKGKGKLTTKIASTRSDDDEFLQLFMAQALAKRKDMSSKWFIKAVGVGKIHLALDLGNGQVSKTVFQDVYHVPELHGNLLSVSRLDGLGYTCMFRNSACRIYDTKKTHVGLAHLSDGLYILAATPSPQIHARTAELDISVSDDEDLTLTAHVATTSKADVHTWHRRLGHLNVNGVLKMIRQGTVKGMEVASGHTKDRLPCTPCLEGKLARKAIPKASNVENPRILYRVYSDLCGPFQTQTRSGYRYFITFIDGKSHYLAVYLLKTKDEALSHTKAFVSRAEVETEEKMNFLRSDGGGE
ncbi:hypothetical protein EW026_g3858 [Hermanssonia centrifuga]|uniref:Uncharacterized protein n=1 Tax=Hermanssonia centrifuga TaxID=98765 RepID=A0A4S4KIY3_9APHY|nr:hypothetical protein EW026_g3858 [Hermanssonia centrifuga]